MSSAHDTVTTFAANAGASLQQPQAAEAAVLARFDFDLAKATFSRSGDDLTATLEDGGTRVFAGLFQDEAALADGVLELADGTLVPWLDFNAIVDITTAAGATASSSGAGSYADGAGQLISGVQALDAANGDTGRRAAGRSINADVPSPALAAAFTVGGAEPGQPVPPSNDGFTARAVLYHNGPEGGGTAVFRLLVDGQPVDAAGLDIQASGQNGYFILPPLVNDDGTLSLVLSEAGRAALAAGNGELLFDYITFTVDGATYTMQVVVTQDGNYDAALVHDNATGAPAPGEIAAEWHTDADGNAGGVRVTGSGNDEVRISSGIGTGFTGSLDTGAGNDLVEITGADKGADNAVISTGSGNDSITVIGQGSTGMFGGSLDAGGGDNRVVIQGAASGASGAAISSGSGDDVFFITGQANYGLVNSTLDAGGGDNAVTISGGYMGGSNAHIVSGSGNDSITVSGGTSIGLYNSSVNAGDGDNVIIVSGSIGVSNTTITTGSGNDSISLTGNRTYGMELGSIDAGDGDNTISITGLAGTNGNITTGSGNDSITLTGTGAQALYGQSNRRPVLDAGDGDNSITLNGTVGALYATVKSGSGSDTVNITGRSGTAFANSDLDVGDGDNRVTITGSLHGLTGSAVSSGTGDDIFTITGSGGYGLQGSRLSSEGGDNQVFVQGKTHGLYDSVIDLGDGDDLVRVAAANTGDASAMYAAGNGASSINGGGGHDQLFLEAVSTGSGKAYGMHGNGAGGLSVTGMEAVRITAESGSGDAYGMFAKNGAVNSIGNADGSITVVITATAGGAGAAYAMFASGGRNVINGSSVLGDRDGDRIELTGAVHAENGGSNAVNTGSGWDVISLNGAVGAGSLEINAGEGYDILVLNAESLDAFTAYYKDWLMDLDARGLISGMSIEAITVHGVGDLADIDWLREIAANNGIDLALGGTGAHAGTLAQAADVALLSQSVAGYGDVLDAHENRDLDGALFDRAAVEGSHGGPQFDGGAQPGDDGRHRDAFYQDAAQQPDLLLLMNGVTV